MDAMSLLERIMVQKKCPPGFHKNPKTGRCERIRITVKPRTEEISGTPYLGIFLTKQSQAKLKKALPPAFGNKSGNHLTIQFAPGEDALEKFQKKIGKKVTLVATHLIQTDSYQAIRIKDTVKTERGFPHITISWKDGSSPKKGNRAMKENKGTAIQPWLKLEGVYDTWPRTISESSLFDRLMEAPDCGDRMRNMHRPDVKALERTRGTTERMSDNARALGGALQCREKKRIDALMTQMGKDLVSIKNAINSPEGKRALDYEHSLMHPKKAKAKVKREPVRPRR